VAKYEQEGLAVRIQRGYLSSYHVINIYIINRGYPEMLPIILKIMLLIINMTRTIR